MSVNCQFCGEDYKWTRSTAVGCGPCLRKNAKPIPMKCTVCGRDSEGMYCAGHLEKMRETTREKGLRSREETAKRNRSEEYRKSRTVKDALGRTVRLDG